MISWRITKYNPAYRDENHKYMNYDFHQLVI